MLEAVKEEPQEPRKTAPRAQRLRIEPIRPTNIVEVWRLFRSFVRARPYPDLTEVSDDILQSHLFNYIQSHGFVGLQAKAGKKLVGIVFGNLCVRPYGHPSRYMNLECLWVEPDRRGNGVGKELWKEYSDRFKKAGIFNFEARVTDKEAESLRADRLWTTLGGRL